MRAILHAERLGPALAAVGVVTLSQHRLQEKEGRALKLVAGLVMLGLGAYLLLPHPN